MVYTPQTWADGSGGGTPISAARLNYMEAGVAAASADASPFLNVKNYGATGDGVTGDLSALNAARDAAISQQRPLYLPAGTYKTSGVWDLRAHNLVVLGAGPQKALILPPDNTPGVRLGLYYQHVEGLGVRYGSQQPSTSTSARGFELAQCAWGVYRRLSVEFAAAGFDTPQQHFNDGFWTDGNYGAFSCTFADLFIGGHSITGFRLKAFNGVVSASGAFTQNLIENVYMKNNHSGSVANSIDSGFILDNGNGSTVNNLNVEHSTYGSSHAVLLQTVDTVAINGLHMEGIEPTWFQGAMIGVYGDGNATINAPNVVWSLFQGAAGDTKSIVAAGAGAKVLVNGLQLRSNTVTGGGLAMFRNHDFGSGGAASVQFLNGDGPGSPFTQLSLADTGQVPLLKQVNDTVYASKNAAGKNVVYGTAAPTTGTWAVGDTVWNTAPAAGGTPGWVCTTAGTPGTWKAMANLAA